MWHETRHNPLQEYNCLYVNIKKLICSSSGRRNVSITGYSVPLHPGDTLSLTCTAQDAKNFTWTFTPSGGSPGPVAYGPSFSKQHVQESDAGTYTCAIGKDYVLYGAVSVTVEVKPVETDRPSPETPKPTLLPSPMTPIQSAPPATEDTPSVAVTTPPSDADTKTPSADMMNKEASSMFLIGGVSGTGALVMILVCIILVICRRRRRRAKDGRLVCMVGGQSAYYCNTLKQCSNIKTKAQTQIVGYFIL